jgi:hypothetical protein
MATILEFNELGVGQQFGLQTTDRGIISAVAIPSPGGGGGSGQFVVVPVSDAAHTFNGDGSAGGIQIFPLTIVTLRTAETAGITWKLDDIGGVDTGWLVAFNIEGADPAAIEIIDQDDVTLQIINVANPTGQTNNVPYPVFFYLVGTGWITLRSRILVP